MNAKSKTRTQTEAATKAKARAADEPRKARARKGRPTVRVLAIDGGGIRGLVPALALERLAGHLADLGDPRELWQHFDLIAGTSTGGIITLGLTAPKDPADPRQGARMTPDRLVRLYREEGRDIFPRWMFNWLRTVVQIEDAKYAADGLEEILERELGDLTTGHALSNILVSAYDTAARQPIFFKKRPPRTHPDGSPKVDPVYRMREAARATSAAPTYFEPIRVRPLNAAHLPADKAQPRCLVDGGVFNNNPAASAYIEARKIWGHQVDVFLVSLGTGITNRRFPCSQVEHWGAREWISPLSGLPLVNVMMDGQADAAHHHLKELLGEHYVRIDGPLLGVQDEMDDASPENIAAIEAFADKLLDPGFRFPGRHATLDQRHNGDLEQVARRLAAIAPHAPQVA